MVGATARLRQFEGNSDMLANLKEIRRLKRVFGFASFCLLFFKGEETRLYAGKTRTVGEGKS